MKILFLHNNNEGSLPFELEKSLGADQFEDYVIYPSNTTINGPDFNMDVFLHENLIEVIEETYDLVIIPYSLSMVDYLGYLGLVVGCHIRLTAEIKNQYTPILYIGQEEVHSVAKLSDESSILYTSGVFNTKAVKSHDILERASSIVNDYGEKGKLSFSQFYSAINKIVVPPPSNYDNRHSLTNEWAINMLNRASGLNNVDIIKKSKSFNSLLYVKLLQQKMSLSSNVEEIKINAIEDKFVMEQKNQILLIEDEWDKGWLEFYQGILPYAKVDHLPIQKGDNRNTIIDYVEKSEISKYDLIILDIRLTDNDHDINEKIKNFTGVQILDYIYKKVNRGTQVLITSASNKIHVYRYIEEQVFKSSFDVFIKPDLGSEVDLRYLNKLLRKPIENRLNRIKLREYRTIIENIIDSSKRQFDNGNKQLHAELRAYINLSFTLIDQSFSNEKYRNIAYLHLYKVIELLAKEYVKETIRKLPDSKIERSLFVKLPHSSILVAKDDVKSINYLIKEKYYILKKCSSSYNIDTNFRVSAVLIYRYGKDSSNFWDWKSVNGIRNNYAAHYSEEIIEVSKFEKLLNLLIWIISI